MENTIDELRKELEKSIQNMAVTKKANTVKDDFPEIKRTWKHRGSRF